MSLEFQYRGDEARYFYNEIRRYSMRRIGEVWLYAAGFLVILSLLARVLTGTWRVVLPLGAIALMGAILGTLLALIYKRQAYERLKMFLFLPSGFMSAHMPDGRLRPLEEIAKEMRQSPIDPKPILALTHSILFPIV
jgi:uncharacterized membrane protein YfcA